MPNVWYSSIQGNFITNITRKAITLMSFSKFVRVFLFICSYHRMPLFPSTIDPEIWLEIVRIALRQGGILFIFLSILLLFSNSYYLLSSSPILSQSCQSIFTFSTPSILYFMSPIIPPSPFGLSSSSPLLSLASWIRCAYAASSCCIHKWNYQ